MSKREKLLCAYAVLLGIAATTSTLWYGISGQFWWVETSRQDGERAFILGMTHMILTIGGVVGSVLLVSDWLARD